MSNEMNEVTKEELMAKRKMSVWAGRIAKVAGIGASTIAVVSGTVASSVSLVNKICEGHNEENPAGFGKVALSCGVMLLASVAEYAEMYGGITLATDEIESWSEDDFKIEEVEAEDCDPKETKFDWE